MKLNVGDDYFLTCLYPKGEGSADDVEHKFLKSQLLVKVCHDSKFFYSFLSLLLTLFFQDFLRNIHLAVFR